MPIRNSITAMLNDAAGWRRELHQNPGLSHDEGFASDFVAEKLAEFGIEFHRNIGGEKGTGIVGVIQGGDGNGPIIALRADMDALPIAETSGQPWTSKVPGVMHACGHDGHTAILLGTAKYLQGIRDTFRGRVLLVFQPAEEGYYGAESMVEQGLFKGKLDCDEIYGLHNWPGAPVGWAGLRPGPFLAASDDLHVTITGKSGHGGMPDGTINPIDIAARVTIALHELNNKNPSHRTVLSVTNNNGGTGATNIIPDTTVLSATVRTFTQASRQKVEKRARDISERIAKRYGGSAEVKYVRVIDPTINGIKESGYAARALRAVLGAAYVDAKIGKITGAEDFGHFLLHKPGAFFALGQGATDASSPHNRALHNAGYDFNDDAIPPGIAAFARITQDFFARKGAGPAPRV